MTEKGVTEIGKFARCRYCKAELSSERDRCPACGTAVPTSARPTAEQPRCPLTRKITHVIIAVLLLIVANIYRPYVEPYFRLI